MRPSRSLNTGSTPSAHPFPRFLHLGDRQVEADRFPISSLTTGPLRAPTSARRSRHPKTNQLYDRATIVLVSDHGQAPGDHGEQGSGLRLRKRLRIPLIMTADRRGRTGHTIAAVVQQIDVVPTILDLAKAPGASGLRGRVAGRRFSVAARLPGRAGLRARPSFGAHRFGWTPVQSLIRPRTARHQRRSRSAVRPEAAATAERTDIAAEHADEVTALKKRLANCATPVSPRKPTPVTATTARFESLGYVGVPGSWVPADGERDEHTRSRVVHRRLPNSRVARANRRLEGTLVCLSRADAGQTRHVKADLWPPRHQRRAQRTATSQDAIPQIALELDPSNASGHRGAATSYLQRLPNSTDAARKEAHKSWWTTRPPTRFSRRKRTPGDSRVWLLNQNESDRVLQVEAVAAEAADSNSAGSRLSWKAALR